MYTNQQTTLKGQHVSLYSVRISFKTEGNIKIFSDIQSLKEFITSSLAYFASPEVEKELLQVKGKGCQTEPWTSQRNSERQKLQQHGQTQSLAVLCGRDRQPVAGHRDRKEP